MLTLAVVACPCHLLIPLAVFGGTAIGAILAANVLPLVMVLGAVFVAALVVGLRTVVAGSGRSCVPQEPRRTPR